MKRIVILALAAFLPWVAAGQSFSEIGAVYHLANDGSNLVISGFQNLPKPDEVIIGNAYIWTLENVCPQLKEGITETSFQQKRFEFDVKLEHLGKDMKTYAYSAHVIIRAKDGKLSYLVTNLLHQNAFGGIVNRATPLLKYAAKETASNTAILEGAEEAVSAMLNKLFDYIVERESLPITHWPDIYISRPVEGMNTDECLLAFGKPLVVSGTDEIQWMYNNSFFLFFRDGIVTTILK